jgi:hypothetical protein
VALRPGSECGQRAIISRLIKYKYWPDFTLIWLGLRQQQVEVAMMNATPMIAPGAASVAALSGTAHHAMDALHALQQLASHDPSFAQALKQTGSTQAAASLARRHGLHVSSEALWRNRGRHGLPTWRG